MRKTKPTIRLAAAMLALLSQIPAAQAEDTPGGAERAEFVSLTPEQLMEVNPQEYLQNPESLDGAQLFYADPESGKDGTPHPSSLLGMQLMLVSPYKVEERKENPEEQGVFCKGRLDNLLLTSQGYWARPSTAFFAVAWPQEKENERLFLDFSRYRTDLQDAAAYEARTKEASAPLDRLLKMQLAPGSGKASGVDFRACPWEGMLEKRSTPEPVVDGKSLDQPVVDDFCSRLGKTGKWPAAWLASTYGIDKREMRSRSGYSLRWTTDPVYTLNKTSGMHDGWLALRNYKSHEWDFAKKTPTAPEPNATAGPVKKGNPASPAGASGLWHFVPVSGIATNYNPAVPAGEDAGRHALGRAVVASPSIQPKAMVLAILADWNRDSCDTDAISLNRDFQVNGGHANPVPVPECSRVALNREEGKKNGGGYLHVAFPGDKGVAQVSWQGDKKLVLQEQSPGKQSPIAYAAGIGTIELKAVVALEKGMGEDMLETLEIVADSTVSRTEFADGNNTAEWAPCTPKNFGMGFENKENTPTGNGLRFRYRREGELTPFAENVVICEEDGSSPGTEYSLYTVTMALDTLNGRFAPYIGAGEMYLHWRWENDETDIAYTELNKVYSIFGPSTWSRTGEVELMPPSLDEAVLPWEDLLNTVTRLWLCDTSGWASSILWKNGDITLQKMAVATLSASVSKIYTYPTADESGDWTPPNGGEFLLQKTPVEWVTRFPGDDSEKDENDTPNTGEPKYYVYLNPPREGENSTVTVSYNGYNIQNWYKAKFTLEPFQNLKFYVRVDAELFNIVSMTNQIQEKKYLICTDSASTLCSIPRICGFNDFIYITNVGLIQHAFNVFDGLVYDATSLQEAPSIEIETEIDTPTLSLPPGIHSSKSLGENNNESVGVGFEEYIRERICMRTDRWKDISNIKVDPFSPRGGRISMEASLKDLGSPVGLYRSTFYCTSHLYPTNFTVEEKTAKEKQ